METLLEIAKGPLLRLTILIMILGLLRHILLLIFDMRKNLKKAATPVPPYSASFSSLTKSTLGWLVPINHIKNRKIYSIISIVFHAGLILVPIFLFAHIQLVRGGIGFGWPAIDQKILDILTIITVVSGVLLFAGRAGNRDSRFISRMQDYLLPWLLIIPFISGFFAAHIHLFPFSYNLMMLIHILSAELVFVLMPASKITHCVLFPLARYASNYAWRFIPEGPEKVIKSLGKEAKV
ncbi:MAG: hypothetical protein GY863_11200 [bacterium]|nr:hypothetical protein [bacterium]